MHAFMHRRCKCACRRTHTHSRAPIYIPTQIGTYIYTYVFLHTEYTPTSTPWWHTPVYTHVYIHTHYVHRLPLAYGNNDRRGLFTVWPLGRCMRCGWAGVSLCVCIYIERYTAVQTCMYITLFYMHVLNHLFLRTRPLELQKRHSFLWVGAITSRWSEKDTVSTITYAEWA